MKKIKKTLIILLILIVALLAIGAGYVFTQYRSDKFFLSTKINGYDVSGMTMEEAKDTITQKYKNAIVKIFEGDTQEQSGYLENYGYTIDTDVLDYFVEQAFTMQRNGIGQTLKSLINGSNYAVRIPSTFDEEKFNKAATDTRFADERIETSDAALVYDETTSEYSITPEVYGNRIPDEELRSLIKTKIDEYISGGTEESELTITIPDTVYEKPTVTADDPALIQQMNAYNMYSKAKVIYTFGEETETLDWNTIKDWVYIGDDGAGHLNEESIRAYLSDFASRHDTRYYQRTFYTTLGTTVTFSGNMNEYGYTTNEASEYEQLVSDITSNTTVTREPVYYTSNDYGNKVFYKRNGDDDLCGTYVEINITEQHLWFYKDGALVIESDFVSGSVAQNHETQTGVFALAYKESPSVLVGSNANDGYQTEVQYWMPFYDGQGMHDATWRSSFGGNIYLTNGSHGCVNLPSDAAAVIYNNIEEGMAIIIYK